MWRDGGATREPTGTLYNVGPQYKTNSWSSSAEFVPKLVALVPSEFPHGAGGEAHHKPVS